MREGRARLFDAVQDFVERQIAMRTKNAGRLLREDALSRIRLSNLDKSDMKIMRELIRKLAKRWLHAIRGGAKSTARHVGYSPHHARQCRL